MLHILQYCSWTDSVQESVLFIYLVYSLLSKALTIQNLFISTAAGVVPYAGL